MLGFDGISSFAVSAVKETGCIGLYGVGYRFFFFLIVLGGWGNVVAWSFYMLMTPLFSQPHLAIYDKLEGQQHKYVVERCMVHVDPNTTRLCYRITPGPALPGGWFDDTPREQVMPSSTRRAKLFITSSV